MDVFQQIMQKAKDMGITSEDVSPLEYERLKIEALNATEGNRNLEDGYECKKCKNKGYIAKLVERDGLYYQTCVECKCAEIRRSIVRMKRSGLKNIIKDYTFDKFEATEEWQKKIKTAGMDYAGAPKDWFFLGGQSGCGKTHICTAICRELLLSGKRVVYMLWRDDVTKIKSAVTDVETYGALIDKYKKADVLYIDDLFKAGKAQDGSTTKITGADINIAFEIINYRYNNPALLTIISSELSEGELLDVDEAVAGRIFEKSTAISIAKSRDRNYRIKKAVTL